MNGKEKASAKIYSTAEAAEYLGLNESQFRYRMKEHPVTNARRFAMSEKGIIRPDVEIGGKFGFYQSTLDAYRFEQRADNFTFEEAAEYLGVSLNRIRHHVKNLRTLEADGKRGRKATFSLAALELARPIITATPTSGRKPKKEE